ncbi:LEA type 2 family protein [Marinomonas algarum]|uniref:LEA type 2 family protein n=1 Tax=Marinomonas algarum TaxID=2883105 RepID=A0A9X1IJX3_9GAMM|nr:LEA type 2 family protein [Marinomonas algarum]MCB5160698.1 LEA type 2 family protein [Marinomonas algarum]
MDIEVNMLLPRFSFAMKKTLIGLLMSFFLLLQGCSVLQETLDVRKPEASVVGVSIDSVSLDEITLLVDVEVVNGNSFPLTAAGFDLDLIVNESKLASIVQANTRLSIPAKGRNSVQFPVTLAFNEVLASVKGLNAKSEVGYGIEGDISINLPVIGDIKMPVDYTGILPIPKKPEINVKDFNVDSVGLSGMKLSADVTIVNPNAFDLSLKEVSYQIKAQGVAIGQGEIAEMVFPKNEERRLTIPLSIGLSDIGSSLYKMLMSSDPIALDMSMAAELETGIQGWKTTPLEFETQQVINR